MLIEKTLEALKQIQGQIYIGEGSVLEFSCRFNPPATMIDIKKFESDFECVVPKDYMRFLLTSNGMQFYEAGDYMFYSTQKIAENLKMMSIAYSSYIKGIYPIAYICEDYIVIKSDEISSGKYIYAGSCYMRDEYYSLDCNFETFFERYVISNACSYWRWQMPGELHSFIE